MDDIFDNILEPEKKENQKNDLDVLNELFSGKGIETRTELNVKQIVLINQKRTLCNILGFKDLDNCLKDFMLLMVSNSRRGRSEFVDGFKAQRENEVQKSGGLSGFLKDKMGFN